MRNIDSSWVQSGELGLAFIVIILCAWLVLYIMKTSSAREKMLMELIENQQSKLVGLSSTIQNLANAVGDLVDRLERVEKKIQIKTVRNKNK
jgi:peptidoglycan hydrolase CwlO-like protein